VPPPRENANSYGPILTLGCTILVIASLYWAQKVLIPIALAILLAFILSPAVMALQRRRMRRVPAVLLVVLLSFAVLAGVGSMVALQLRSFAQELPARKGQIAAKISRLLEAGRGGILEQVRSSVQEISDTVLKKQGGDGSAKAAEEQPVPVRVESTGYSQILEAIGPAAETLATTGLVIILVIFILIRREDVRNRLVRLIGHGQLIFTTRAMDEAADRISRYLMMQVLINAGFGLGLTVGLFLIGVPYALLWGILAAVLRFVPYIGSWLALSLLMAFCVAFFDGWTQPLLVLVLFGILELLTANAVEPLLFGHSTGMSSLALLVAAAFWTWLWGPIGLVLSTPLTACLVVLGKYVPQLEFFAILLGDEPVLDAEVTYYQRLLAHDQDEATELVEAHLQDHTLETVYDEVLIPALSLTKRDRAAGDLTAEDEEFILHVTRDVLEDLVSHQQQIHAIATQGVGADHADADKTLVFGCPARDAEDELALQMFAQLLETSHCRFEVLSAQTLSGELIARVEHDRPALVCIASLPPGGLSLARYLCKRLRAHFPELKIVIGCWGLTQNVQRARDRLLAAGANGVATTLLEARSMIVPLARGAGEAAPAAAKALEPAAAQ
jgi:predicted PurR-regulated permease PerM